MAQSLVLVTVDCLRSDHVGFMGYARPTTPILDSLARDACVFSQAIVAGAPTYYSFPAMLASRFPLALGRDVVGLAPGEHSLALVLQQSGYATAAFNAGNPYLSARFGYDQGFDVFRDFLDVNLPSAQEEGSSTTRTRWNQRFNKMSHRLGLGELYEELYFQYAQRLRGSAPESFEQLRRFPAADVIVDEAASWIRTVQGRPFFLWIHLMDPHAPYYPAQEALGLMGDGDITPRRALYLNQYWNRRELPARRLQRYKREIVCLYDAGIRWVDMQMGRLVETLKSVNAWDDCLLVFTADHGEEFLEHEGRFHPQWTAKEELIHVPLFMRFPKSSATHTTDAVFSHVDLGPTLLDAMSVPLPDAFQGRSRLGDLQSGKSWDEAVIVDCTESINPNRPDDRIRPRVLCIRDRRYKLTIRFGSQQEELFDLENDPAETNPLPLSAATGIRRRLLEHAHRHLSRTPAPEELKSRMSARIRNFQMDARPKS